MKILMATSEAVPFAKTGGLADVCGALPVELARLGHQPALILPAYRQIRYSGLPIAPMGIDFIVPIGSKTVSGHLLQSKLPGVDTYLGPEMKSTGEVMGIDYDFGGALAKALLASGLAIPPDGSVLLSVADRDKSQALPVIRKLSQAGYRLYATEGTSDLIKTAGLEVTMISKKISEGHPNVIDIIQGRAVDAVVNTTTAGRVPMRDGFEIRRAAAEQRIPCFTSIDTARVAVEALLSVGQLISVQPLPEYLNRPQGQPVRGVIGGY